MQTVFQTRPDAKRNRQTSVTKQAGSAVKDFSLLTAQADFLGFF
jgi:hypothetical protein